MIKDQGKKRWGEKSGSNFLEEKSKIWKFNTAGRS